MSSVSLLKLLSLAQPTLVRQTNDYSFEQLSNSSRLLSCKRKATFDNYCDGIDITPSHPYNPRSKRAQFRPATAVPAPRLVGIEPNPGPKNNNPVAVLSALTSAISLAKSLTSRQPKPAVPNIINRPSVQKSSQSTPQSTTMSVGAAYSKKFKTPIAKMNYSNNGDLRVRHREFITDLLPANATFETSPYNINPGNPALFEWLAPIASRFESYNINSLKFIYETELGSTAAGSIMLGIDYDLVDPPPTTKQQLMSYESSVRAAPWQECIHVSTPKNLSKHKTYYVQYGLGPLPNTPSVATNSKLEDNMSYVGRLFLASQGTSIANQGEVYVEYDISLFNPVSNHYAPTGNVATTSTALATPFSSSTITGNLGLSTDGGTYLFFPISGSYFVEVTVYGTTILNTFYQGVVATNGASISGGRPSQGTASSLTAATYSFVMTVPNNGELVANTNTGAIIVNWTGYMATSVGTYVRVTKHDQGVIFS